MDTAMGNSFVIFRLGEELYGVPVESVNSIIRYEESTPVPRAPHSVMGVINLRGRVIPVIDLGERFSGAGFVPAAQSRIVVAETSSGLVGLAVDEASEVVELPADSFRPIPEGVLAAETSKAFTAVAERDARLIILLDLEETVPKGTGGMGATDERAAGGESDE